MAKARTRRPQTRRPAPARSRRPPAKSATRTTRVGQSSRKALSPHKGDIQGVFLALFAVVLALGIWLEDGGKVGVFFALLFRGLFVGWTGGRWYRPWAVLTLAAVPAISVGVGPDGKVGPLVFLGVLAVGLYAILRLGSARPGFPSRTVVSIYATAALFALAHSRVWPSPVPLFVLGIALGYLATRTNRIAACVVLHGLFNAVSFVYVLRGGSG